MMCAGHRLGIQKGVSKPACWSFCIASSKLAASVGASAIPAFSKWSLL